MCGRRPLANRIGSHGAGKIQQSKRDKRKKTITEGRRKPTKRIAKKDQGVSRRGSQATPIQLEKDEEGKNSGKQEN